jgi:hypothetical protein
MKKKTGLLIIFILLTAFLMGGCKMEDQDSEKIRDIEFTVLDEELIPEEFKLVIDEKKQEVFRLTYNDGQYTYIAEGYGEQPTSGYSIVINEVYLSSNAVYFDSNLMGPEKDDEIIQTPTCPYIVIKLENIDKPVVFK